MLRISLAITGIPSYLPFGRFKRERGKRVCGRQEKLEGKNIGRRHAAVRDRASRNLESSSLHSSTWPSAVAIERLRFETA